MVDKNNCGNRDAIGMAKYQWTRDGSADWAKFGEFARRPSQNGHELGQFRPFDRLTNPERIKPIKFKKEKYL